MFDLLISYFNFIILSIKYFVSFLTFRPPNPKGVRIKEEKVENINDNNNIEILYSVPVNKENENKNKINTEKKGNTNNIKKENLENKANNKGKPNENNQKVERKLEYKPASNRYAEFELIYLGSKDKKIKIPAFIFRPKDFIQYNCIIIYCHGNSGDIGTSFLECQFLSRNLRCEVLSFEYPGYGLSNDLNFRNEKRAYIYIREVYKYVKEQMGYQPHNIIIYGFSLGTGIAFDLACDKKYPNGGVILQSPFLSITRIFYNFKKTYYFDMFNSIDKVKFCESTIYIIHGTKDTIVPYIHGRILAKLLPKKCLYDFYTVPDANHNDLIKFAREQLYINISNFIYEMLNKKPSLNEEITNKDKESSDMDLSSMKSDTNFHPSEKRGFKELTKKIEMNNNNEAPSSKEKLNKEEKEEKEDKEDNNNNKSIKSEKSNKELKQEMSGLFKKADDNDDTFIDRITKVINKNDIKITVKEN